MGDENLKMLKGGIVLLGPNVFTVILAKSHSFSVFQLENFCDATLDLVSKINAVNSFIADFVMLNYRYYQMIESAHFYSKINSYIVATTHITYMQKRKLCRCH